MNNIKSKTKNGIEQDIYLHNFIFIVSSYFKYYLQNSINKNYKINVSSHLKLIINNILYLLFYKNNTKGNINNILKILNISKENLVYTNFNRHYERIRKKPSSSVNMVINIK